MSVKFNHLKLNKDKTQFIWLGVPLQLSKVQCQKITMGGTDIQIFTEAICLGVLLDRRLSGRCFYHLRRSQKMQRRRWCMRLLQVELITATVLFTVQVRFTVDPCKMHSMQLLDLCCISGSLTMSLLTFGIVYIGYHFSIGWSTRSVC